METLLNKRKKTHRELIKKAYEIETKIKRKTLVNFDWEAYANSLRTGDIYVSDQNSQWILEMVEENPLDSNPVAKQVTLANADLPQIKQVIGLYGFLLSYTKSSYLQKNSDEITIYNFSVPKEYSFVQEFYNEIIETFGTPDNWLNDKEILKNIAYPLFAVLNITNFKKHTTMAKIDIYNLKDIPKSKIPKEAHEAYDLYLETIKEFGEPDNWINDDDFKEITETIYELIDMLNELNINAGKKQRKTKKTPAKKKTKAKTAEKKSAKPKRGRKKSTTSKKKKSTAKAVEKVDPQITVIKSFYLMLDKPVPRKRILNLYKKIERFATERIIRKKDKYAAEIEDISRILAEAYNKGKEPVTISINEDDKKRLKEIAYSQKQRESVRIIKSFLTFLSNQTEEKAERLLERIEKALDNEKITDKDPYYDKIMDIEDWLTTYLKKGKTIKLTSSQLNGLIV